MRSASEIRGAMIAVHRVKLNAERKVRINAVHLGVRTTEQHEQRACSDEGADLKDLLRLRAMERLDEVIRVHRRNRPLAHDIARVTHRFECIKHSAECVSGHRIG